MIKTAAQKVYIALIFIFMYAPIATLIVLSFNASRSRAKWGGFTTKWYVELFSNQEIMQALYNTLLIALLSAVIATLIGTIAALSIQGMKKKNRAVLMGITNIPILNAEIVTGISLMLLFLTFRAKFGFTTILLSHITFNIPYVILSIMPKLRQMDKNLVDAAQDLGCTWMQAFWKVVVPEIKPGIVNGLLIAFTMSVDDFVISYFTAGSTTANLAMRIYAMTKKRISPEVNAISTLLFATVLILLIVINLREASQEKAARKLRR